MECLPILGGLTRGRLARVGRFVQLTFRFGADFFVEPYWPQGDPRMERHPTEYTQGVYNQAEPGPTFRPQPRSAGPQYDHYTVPPPDERGFPERSYQSMAPPERRRAPSRPPRQPHVHSEGSEDMFEPDVAAHRFKPPRAQRNGRQQHSPQMPDALIGSYGSPTGQSAASGSRSGSHHALGNPNPEDRGPDYMKRRRPRGREGMGPE